MANMVPQNAQHNGVDKRTWQGDCCLIKFSDVSSILEPDTCRQGLEMLSEKVWRWLGSHELGVLNLQLAGVGAEPGLRNLCEALRKRIDDAAHFNHANKPRLLAAYGRILGIPAANLVWTYLNKGTHEEANRDDFDADLVESVVRTLEEVDALDLRAGR